MRFKWQDSHSNSNFSEASLALAFCIFFISLTFVAIKVGSHSYERTLYENSSALENYARVTATAIDASLIRVETALSHWAIALKEHPEQINPQVDHYLESRRHLLDDIPGLDVHVVDTEGNVLVSPNLPDDASIAGHENLASQPWFAKLAADKDAIPMLSPPVRSRIKPERFVMQLSQRISGPGGEFLGVIVASFDTSHFKATQNEIELGPGTILALAASADLVLFEHYPTANNLAGNRLEHHHALIELANGKTHHTHYNSKLPGEKNERTFAAARVGRFPILVIVGRDLSSVLEPWYQQVLFSLIALLVVITGGVYFLMRHHHDLRAIATNQQLLAQERHKLEQIVSKAPAIFYTLSLDADHPTTFMSPEIKLLGYKPEDFLYQGKFWLEQVHPQDLARVTDTRSKLGPQRAALIEYRLRSAKGTYRWMRDQLSLNLNESGEPTNIIGFLQDVEYEVTTRERFELLNEAIDHTAIISTTNANGTITHVNQRFCEISGYSREELLGESHRILNSGEHDRKYFQSLWQALSANRVWRGEIRNRHKDGSFYWVNTTISPYFAGGGERSFISISFETTQEKALQDRLLTSAKLSALGEMSGGVAHEINNPVSIIISKARLLQRKLENDLIAKEPAILELKKIEDTGQRIARIVKGLRTFARNGETDPLERVSLRQIVADTLDLSSERFRQHAVEIHMDELPDIVMECRPTEISQILLNLLNNAHDAIESNDERWVEIAAAVEDDFVRIAVTDSGNGIPADVVSRMMEPFYTTKGVGRGTGLGLSISSGIAKSHHGELSYDSTSPHTRFILRLPLSQLADKGQAA